jgi:hypothetical protein
MLDPNFDPLSELEEQGDLINKLIQHHNNHDGILVDLSTQHKALVDLLRTDRAKIVHLENKVKVMSEMIGELYADRSN